MQNGSGMNETHRSGYVWKQSRLNSRRTIDCFATERLKPEPPMSHRRSHSSSRPKSRAESVVVQFEETESKPSCGVSECWSPNSEEIGIVPPPPGSRGSFRRQQQRLANPSRSRPMGGIEKVIEYRQVPNSGGSVELRRVTPSVDGPVEHIDVVEPIHQETASQRSGSRTSPRKWRSSLRDNKPYSSNKRPSSSASTTITGSRPKLSPSRTPWLDFEGPPAQQAALWGAQMNNPGVGYRRLTMNGSQPCLMIMPDQSGLHMHHPGATFHHFYDPHMRQPMQDGYHQQQQPFFQDGHSIPGVHGSYLNGHSGRMAGSQPCLYLDPEPSLQYVQPQTQPHTGTGGRRKPSVKSSQRQGTLPKGSLKRSESFTVPSSAWVNLPPPPPPGMQLCDDLQQQPKPASMSPLEVVRNKRASQANWEREHLKQRRASAAGGPLTPDGECSSIESILSCGPPKSALSFGVSLMSAPLLRSGSCTRVFPESEDDCVDTVEDDRLPPPPSPPCTCGKNLELPPTPPQMGLKQDRRLHSHHQHHRDRHFSHHRVHGQRVESNGIMPQKLNGDASNSFIMDDIDGDGQAIHQASKDKEVSFANCTGKTSSSPPTPNRSSFSYPQPDFNTIINNEAYPCDCCRIDNQYYPSNINMAKRHQFEDCITTSNGISSSNGVGHHRASSSMSSGKHGPEVKSPKLFRAKLIETERGISLEFGKFVALISFSGVRFRRQHWCLLSVILLIVVLSIAIGLPLSSDEIPMTPEERIVAVKSLLKEVPLVDGHNDLPWNIRKFIHNKLHLVNFTNDLRMVKPWSESVWSHTDLYRMNQGGLGGQFWVAYAPCGSQHKDAVQVTLEQIDLIKRFIAQYPKLQFVNDSAGVVEAHAENRIASLISVESGHSIGTSLAVLRMYHRLGAISLTLTHNCNTPWADCSNVDKPGGTPEHNGLSKFGKTVIKELNRLGMIIDLSHSSHATSKDTIETSEAPVIFSHSSAYSICNSTRNVRDDVLKLLAKKNGLVMVNFFSYFLTCSNRSSINDVVAHLNHIKKVAGVDHVGIGASYDGINSVPAGMEDVSKYPELFATLLASGMWTIEDLKKLAGLNFLRVFKEVERVSQRLRDSLVGPSEDHIDGQLIKDYISCRSVAKRDANFTAC